MKRDFNKWLSNFKTSIVDYTYYVDFKKVYKNTDELKIELNILNSLIGSKNIEDDFRKILNEYPNVLRCIPILLAVRNSEIYATDNGDTIKYSFKNMNLSIDQYCVFMQKTGLFNLIKNHIISNLVDYVTGVETGLDSNGRKNRTGHLMENLVESYIKKAGFIKNISYFKEMYINEISSKWNIDLSNISNYGKTEKRFDFVIKGENKVYGIETNFYFNNGSKLNETARSYKTIALESNEIEKFEFVWITDGYGWKGAKNNLIETYEIMEHLYNINDLKNGIIERLK